MTDFQSVTQVNGFSSHGVEVDHKTHFCPEAGLGMKVTKHEFEQAALDHTCCKCGRVFKTVRDTKIHMIKIHVMEKNSYYLTFKEDASTCTLRPTVALDRAETANRS